MLLEGDPRLKSQGLLALDLDGVLLPNQSSWDAYHRILGTNEGRKRNMGLYFSGQIDYETWARMDAELWKGMDSKPIKEYLQRMDITPGANQLITDMREIAVEPIIISTGILSIAKTVGRALGIDTVIANEVEMKNGRITGNVRVNCGFEEKGRVLRRLGEARGIQPNRWACVGDDMNDLSMFKEAAYSVAFNPKSTELEGFASAVIRSKDLYPVRNLLKKYLTGLQTENLDC